MGCQESVMTIDTVHVPSLPVETPLDARVTRVLDGDTVEAVIALPIGEALPGTGCCGPVAFVCWRVRLQGIDAPELHPARTSPFRDLEKTAAERVKAILAGRLENQRVVLTLHRWDKFGGRVIGDIIHDHQDISSWLLELEYVRPYMGDRKPPWTEEQLNLIIRVPAG